MNVVGDITASNARFSNIITAQTLVVQVVSSSITYSSGSNVFGNLQSNTQVMTGSVLITGSVGIGTSSPNANLTVWTPSTTGMQTALRLNNPFGFTNANTGAKIVFSQDRTTAEDYPMSEIGVGQESAGTSASGYIFFSTRNSTVIERMRITSGGNIGIGTSTPTSYGSSYTVLDINGTTSGVLNILNNATLIGQIAGGTNDFYIEGKGASTNLRFITNLTERMRILNDGRISIGTTTPTSSSLYIHGPLNNGNGLRVGNFFAGAQSAGSDYPAIGYNMRFTATTTIQYEANDFVSYIYFGSGKISTFTTTSAGSAGSTVSATTGPFVTNGGTTWSNGSSDQRLKKNFETTQGLAEVLQMEPVKYHFNWENNSATKRLGFKAQNLQPLIPEMVQPNGEKFEDGSDILTFTPDYILPVLVKAIQELKAENDTLKAILQRNNIQ
jgi:hypothetical protein